MSVEALFLIPPGLVLAVAFGIVVKVHLQAPKVLSHEDVRLRLTEKRGAVQNRRAA